MNESMTTFQFPKEVKKALGQLANATTARRYQEITDKIYDFYKDKDEINKLEIFRLMNAQRRAENYKDWKMMKRKISGEGIINAWERTGDDSWSIVIIIEAESEGQAEHIARKHIYDFEGYSSCYPGQPFSRPAYLQRLCNNRWIVTQRGGLDV